MNVPNHCRTHAASFYSLNGWSILFRSREEHVPMMIRRQRKQNAANDETHQVHSDDGYIKIPVHLPTHHLTSAAPKSAGYIHVDNSSQRSVRSQKRKRISRPSKATYSMSRLWVGVVVGFLYYFGVSYYKLSTYSYSRRKQMLIPREAPSLKNNLTILLPPQRFQIPHRKMATPNIQSFSYADDTPDYGDLVLRFPEYPGKETAAFRRVIYHDVHEDTEYDDIWNTADDDGSIESYYSFDDDDKRNPFTMFDDPDIHRRKKCRRTNWHREQPITCNTMHEFGLNSHINMGDAKFLGYVDSLTKTIARVTCNF